MEDEHGPEETLIERVVERALERQLPRVLARRGPALGEAEPRMSSPGGGSELFSQVSLSRNDEYPSGSHT